MSDRALPWNVIPTNNGFSQIQGASDDASFEIDALQLAKQFLTDVYQHVLV